MMWIITHVYRGYVFDASEYNWLQFSTNTSECASLEVDENKVMKTG